MADITKKGDRFGCLEVTGRVSSRNRNVVYECRCECGMTFTRTGSIISKWRRGASPVPARCFDAHAPDGGRRVGGGVKKLESELAASTIARRASSLANYRGQRVCRECFNLAHRRKDGCGCGLPPALEE